MRTFPVIRDLVTDVSFNYEKARRSRPSPPTRRSSRASTGCSRSTCERSQEFRKCIECFLCQNTCHVVRDHEDNKDRVLRSAVPHAVAELDMHPLDERATAGTIAQEEHGLGLCNITKCCTEVCPEHIKITDNALIPIKERVVDRKYDPLVWLGSKISRRPAPRTPPRCRTRAMK